MLNSNTSTTAAQTNIRGYLMHLRNQNQRSQTDKQSSPWSFLLTVRCQPTISTPSSPCLQCHDGSYLSLSALQCLTCQAKPNCFRLQSQGHQCKSPSSPTVPAHYRTSGVQLLTSYFQTTQISHLTHAAIQFSHEPRSLTKQKSDPPGSHATVSLSYYHLQA